MKLTAVLLIAFIVQAHAGSAQTVTLSQKNVSLKEVFAAIKQQTGYVVFFNTEALTNTKLVSVDVKDMPLTSFLDEVLKGQPLTYALEGNTISISRKPVDILSQVFMNIPVKGRIVDADGRPVAGATVRVLNTSQGSVTNEQGDFEIKNLENGATVEISAIGYAPIRMTLKDNVLQAAAVSLSRILESNGGNVKIQLAAMASSLEDVTVSSGYWTVAKRRNVGNIAKVTAKDIENQPIGSPLLALQGRVAGMEIVPGSGIPGSVVKVKIRGQNSLRRSDVGDGIDGNLPLYIVDGIPIDSRPLASNNNYMVMGGYDPISYIDPSNIESIQVLKDADATAIYGSRGANGVILITTKNRKLKEKLSVDADVYRGSSERQHKIKMLNTEQYLQMRWEAINNDGDIAWNFFNDPIRRITTFYDLTIWDTTRYTNWQDELFGKASGVTDVRLFVSGGSDRTTFRLGGSFYNETLMYPGDFYYRRANASFGANHTSADRRFQTGFGVDFGTTKHRIADMANLVSQALILPPVAPKLFKDDGSYNWEPDPVYHYNTWINPMVARENLNYVDGNNININGFMNYEVVTGLVAKVTVGLTNYNGFNNMTYPMSGLNPYDTWKTTGRSDFLTTNRRTWIVEPQLIYTKKINDHTIDALVGTTWQDASNMNTLIVGAGYTNDALIRSLTAAPTIEYKSSSSSMYRYNAVFARLGYTFRDKFLANITGRRDGSSRFGPDRQFGNFGAVGLGWIFSNETWLMEAAPVIGFGKLRASYGITGNDQIGDNMFMKTYNPAYTNYGGGIPLIPTGLDNPELRWERTAKLEFGLEMGLFNDRISYSVSYFSNRSTDQLIRYPLPSFVGDGSVMANLPATLENKGWEFELSTNNITTRNFSWRTAANITFPKDKLVSFPGIETSPYRDIYQVGSPLTIQRGYTWAGVDPETGVHTFKDITGDGVITYDDYGFIRPLTTKLFGGISNTLRYKTIELSFLFQFSDRMARTLLWENRIPGDNVNLPVSATNRWQKKGDITSVAKYSIFGPAAESYYSYLGSDALFGNITFVRLKTLTAAYTLPSAISEKMRLQNLRLYVQANNLLTFTNYDGWDPESLMSAPTVRTISAGLSVKL